MSNDRKDPYRSFRFSVEIGGIIVGGFSEISGLQAETEFEEIREGGVNDFIHKRPKITKYPNIVLKRGIIEDYVLWDWHQDVVAGKIKRTNIFVTLMDEEGNGKWHWTFSNAYPVKWTGPDLKADSSIIAIETLEIAHNGIKKG